jgi:hypothetical protein
MASPVKKRKGKPALVVSGIGFSWGLGNMRPSIWPFFLAENR